MWCQAKLILWPSLQESIMFRAGTRFVLCSTLTDWSIFTYLALNSMKLKNRNICIWKTKRIKFTTERTGDKWQIKGKSWTLALHSEGIWGFALMTGGILLVWFGNQCKVVLIDHFYPVIKICNGSGLSQVSPIHTAWFNEHSQVNKGGLVLQRISPIEETLYFNDVFFFIYFMRFYYGSRF